MPAWECVGNCPEARTHHRAALWEQIPHLLGSPWPFLPFWGGDQSSAEGFISPIATSTSRKFNFSVPHL